MSALKPFVLVETCALSDKYEEGSINDCIFQRDAERDTVRAIRITIETALNKDNRNWYVLRRSLIENTSESRFFFVCEQGAMELRDNAHCTSFVRIGHIIRWVQHAKSTDLNPLFVAEINMVSSKVKIMESLGETNIIKLCSIARCLMYTAMYSPRFSWEEVKVHENVPAMFPCEEQYCEYCGTRLVVPVGIRVNKRAYCSKPCTNQDKKNWLLWSKRLHQETSDFIRFLTFKDITRSCGQL